MPIRRYGVFFILFCLALFALAVILPAGAGHPPKNVIFMVPDGMGLSNVTIARTYLFGPKGGRLSFETLPCIGYQRTSSRNSFITDSAAGASAWASGEKFNNGEISCRDEDGDGHCDGTRANRRTILEQAEAAGMATGLVATSDITHATPAAWGAHVHNRSCEAEIFRQYLENRIDVLLGGGIAENHGPCRIDAPRLSDDALVELAASKGYAVVSDRSALARAAGSPQILGLFKPGGLTPVYQRPADSREPTLEEMTRAALATLEKNAKGFFLVVEGSQIDWANHSRNLAYQTHEVIAFHRAVQAVRDWMARSPDRSKNTLLIVAADHETGGVVIKGPYGRQPRKGRLEDLEVGFANKGPLLATAEHTAADTLVWSNHPGCAKALENTDLFYIMKDFLGLQADHRRIGGQVK